MITSNLENIILILLISSLLQSIALVYLIYFIKTSKLTLNKIIIENSKDKVKIDTSLKDHEEELNLKGLFKKNGS